MPHRFAIWTAAILLFGVALLGVGIWIYEKLQALGDLESVEKLIDEDFPDVEQMPAAALAEWGTVNPDGSLLIIDCRNPTEYAVSHLPGSVNLRTVAEVRTHLEGDAPRPDLIVTYCSVGWRSSKLARAMKKSGVENVVNLRGAIFRWANDDRPLEDANGEATEQVHPYHTFWSGLLKPGKVATD